MRHFLAWTVICVWACGPEAPPRVESEPSELQSVEVYDSLNGASRVETWFPLQEGNFWVLVRADGAEKRVSVVEMRPQMALLEGLWPTPVWVAWATPEATTLQVWMESAWGPLVRFGSAHDVWRTSSVACRGLNGHRAMADGLGLLQPSDYLDARRFEYAIEQSPRESCAPPFDALSFVAHVGLVELVVEGEVYVLKEAWVEGNRISSAAPSVEAKLVTDASDYISSANTHDCVSGECASNEVTAQARISFELYNRGTQPQRWDFSTHCQLDIEVFSSAGTLLHHVTEPETCTAEASSFTLEPGEAKRFERGLSLVDDSGLQLDGLFIIRVRLKPQSATSWVPHAAATVSVAIQKP